METRTVPDPSPERRREVLRQASVALQGRVVTLWEVSSRAEVIPVQTSATTPDSRDTRLDLDSAPAMARAVEGEWGVSLFRSRSARLYGADCASRGQFPNANNPSSERPTR